MSCQGEDLGSVGGSKLSSQKIVKEKASPSLDINAEILEEKCEIASNREAALFVNDTAAKPKNK
jgi:hypothetical protein